MLFQPGAVAKSKYVLFPGDYKTQIRLGMRLDGDMVTYSNVIDSVIHPAQFELEPATTRILNPENRIPVLISRSQLKTPIKPHSE